MVQTTPPMPPGLDPNYVFGELMPLLAAVCVILAAAVGLRWLFRTPVGDAIARRIHDGRRPGTSPGTERGRSRPELEDRIAQLQEQVGELAERVDFAERLLAARREPPLGKGE